MARASFRACFWPSEAAQRSIELELYLVEDGHCAELFLLALLDARRRGVAVRCLFDGFGCLGLGSAWGQRLREAGGELRLYNPLRWKLTGGNLYRDHRKLLLVDGRIGYVGGAGITDEFWDPVSDVSAWREVMVEMDGPVVADWAALFERQWQACLEDKAWKPREGMTLTRLPPQPGAEQGLGRGGLRRCSPASRHPAVAVRALNGSRRRIWLATPYFLPTWKVRRALRKAAQRGVEVRLAARRAAHRPRPCYAMPDNVTTRACCAPACRSMNTGRASCT
ncbi:phospholipase [Pseudomonas aeruginosa]|nr:phospholipase [Pseudomonas aeruginosa]